MNAYILDRDPKLAAQYHGDKHLKSAALEGILLLNNALLRTYPNYLPRIKASSKNSDLTTWVCESRENVKWVRELALALCEEYTLRFAKPHPHLATLKKWNADHWAYIDNKPMTPFIKCMPKQYQVEDAVQSYRQYYKGNKSYLAQWRGRSIPAWWNETADLGKVKIIKPVKKHSTSYELYARGWERIFGRPALAQMEAAQVQMIVPKPPLHQPVIRFDEPLWDDPLIQWHDEDEVPF